jgi:DNA polymerase-3 subunit epsilon
VSFDLETTGLDPANDRVVEICCLKQHPDGRREQLLERVHPGCPIAPAASAVHGIYDADVADRPPFSAVAERVLAFCRGADLTGFNVERFDIPMLRAEYARLGTTFPAPFTSVIDSCRIFFRKEPRDLSAALALYCGRQLVGAHGALADATAALDVLEGQVARYGDLPTDVYALHEYTHPKKPEWLDGEGKVVWNNGEAALSFGKHKNKSLLHLCREQPDYLRWLAFDSNMPSDVKALVKNALDGDLPAMSDEVRAALAPAEASRPKVAAAKTEPAGLPMAKGGLGRGGQGSLF